MDFGNVFGKAFSYPLNLKIILILFIYTLFITLPVTLYSPTFTGKTPTLSELKAFFNLFIPLWAISFFVGNFLAAFFYDSASRYSQKMKYGKLKDSYEKAKSRYLPLLATQILLFLIVILVFFVFGGFSFVFIFFNLPVIFLIGLLIGISAAVIAAFFLFLSPFFCVLDKSGPVDSLKKSFKLIKINKLNTFIFWIILFIVVIFIGMIGSLPSVFYSIEYQSLTGKILLTIIQLIFGAYSGLFVYSAQVNFYHSLNKQRTKKKGKK